MSPVPPEELFSFPCEHLFKVFGPNDEQFVVDVHSALAGLVSVDIAELKLRPSSGGAHQCVSVLLLLNNFNQLQMIYASLKSVSRLKFLL